MAASLAVDLSKHDKPSTAATTLLAQVTDGDCCCNAMPCMSPCNNQCDEDEEHEKDGHIEEEVDIIDVAVPDT